MRYIYALLLLLVLSMTAVVAQTRSNIPSNYVLNYFLKSRGDAKILVIEIDEMIGSKWTNGNPPKAKVKVLNSLAGGMPAHESIQLQWTPKPRLMCGNDPHRHKIWERWKNFPCKGFKKGDKQIVIALPDKDKENSFTTRQSDMMPYTVASEKELIKKINTIKSEKSKL